MTTTMESLHLERALKRRESARKVLRENRELVVKGEYDGDPRSLRESVRAQTGGLDICDPEIAALIDINRPGFSLKEFRESVYRYTRSTRGTLREANDESSLGALLRAGVQTAINSASEYEGVDEPFLDIVQMVASNKAIELYNPLYRAGFPKRVMPGEEPQRIKAQGMDLQIRNGETAVLFEVTEQMFEDDLSNQLQDQPRQIGENYKLIQSNWAFQRWLGIAGVDFGGDVIPASQTGSQLGETNGWPFSLRFVNGGGSNRLTTYQVFNLSAIIKARQLALTMLDPKGQKMLVNPDTIVSGTAIADAIALFLKSDKWPNTGAIAGATGAGTSTGVGTTFADNILKGAYHPVVSRQLPATCYGIGQGGKGLIFQERRPLRVLQENPTSGPAFTTRVFRHRVDGRWETDWLEPRNWILCNDGSAT